MQKIFDVLKNKKVPKKFEKYQIKLYEDSDHNQLIELYQKVFPGYISRDLWEWKNLKNPFGNFITIIIKNRGEIIASYTVAPKIFYINGKKCKSVQSMDTMTREGYRGLGISTFIGELCYDYVRKSDYNFVYGFPNKISCYLFEVKLKWDKVVMCQYFSKSISRDKNSKKSVSDGKYVIKEINKFDSQVDLLWEKSKMNYPIIIMKNKKYLDWRFSAHPVINYRKYYLNREKNDELLAYFILKRYRKNNNNKIIGHIVDFYISSSDIKLKREIFQVIERYALNEFKEDCHEVSLWIPYEDLKNVAKQKLNYKMKENLPFFGYKIINKFKESYLLSSLDNWTITMANNDVF